MKKQTKKEHVPGSLFNAFQKKKNKKAVIKGNGRLRPASVVVADEQRSSHQYYKRNKRKMTNIGLIKKGGKKTGKTNIGIMKQTGKQTEARKNKKTGKK